MFVGFRSAKVSVLSLVMPIAISAQTSRAWTDPSPHQPRFVTVDSGVRLEVLDWGGRGPTLLLLSQLGQTAHSFDDWAPRLAKEFHVLAMTRRGFGASDAPSGGYTLPRLAEDVRDVMAALDVRRVLLAGNAFAGDEMSWIAARDSTRLAGLVFLDAAYHRAPHDGPREPTLPPQPPAAADLASLDALRAWSLRNNGFVNPEADTRATIRLADDGRIMGPRYDPSVIAQIVRTIEAPEYARFRVPALGIYARRTNSRDAAPQCRQAQDPSFLAKCRQVADWLALHLTEGERELREDPAGVQIVEIDDASPFIYLSNEEQVTRAIEQFVGERLPRLSDSGSRIP